MQDGKLVYTSHPEKFGGELKDHRRLQSGQIVRYRLEKAGRGGKTVTVLFDLDSDDESLKELLKKLKGRLGTGGTVKNGRIEIQGDHSAKMDELLKQAGYQPKRSGA